MPSATLKYQNKKSFMDITGDLNFKALQATLKKIYTLEVMDLGESQNVNPDPRALEGIARRVYNYCTSEEYHTEIIDRFNEETETMHAYIQIAWKP